MTDEDQFHANQIIEEIKQELEVLKKGTEGWIKVDHPGYRDRYHAIDIALWCEENLTGGFNKMGRTFYFKEEKDASMFIMKYL